MSALPPGPQQPFWTVLADFPLYVVRVFVHPRSVVRSADWDGPGALQRLALYALLWLGILVWAFSDNRPLSEDPHPRLSTFKGVVMRAHDRGWEAAHGQWQWLRVDGVYRAFNHGLSAAKRLWDTLLTAGFLAYAFFAGLLATAIVARLRMLRFGLSWEYALGTALPAYLACATLLALSLVPLALLFICGHCTVRLVMFVLLNAAGWGYYGYYTLADLGERPTAMAMLVGRSVAWGLAQFIVAYLIFLLLLLPVFPMV